MYHAFDCFGIVLGFGGGFSWGFGRVSFLFFFSKKSLAHLMISTDENYVLDSKPPFDQGTIPGTWFRPVFSHLYQGIFSLEKFCE